MKNKLFSYFIILFLINFTSNAQIFASSSTGKSITITPSGVKGNLASPTLPTSNTALGEDALKLATTVINNTAIGYKALSAVTIIQNNSAGSFNTAVGSSSLQNNTTGYDNSALGVSSLLANTTGNANSAFGAFALASNLGGNDNAAFGKNALTANTTIGINSGYSNSAFGKDALKANTTGYYNAAFGSTSMLSNTLGHDNAAFGYNSLAGNLIGVYNAAFGANALKMNTGDYNTAVGASALAANLGGDLNTAMGYQAMFSNTTGHDNVAVGKNALYSNLVGFNNVAIGEGSLNAAIGNNNVAIGYNAGFNETGSSKLYIDNSSTAAPLIGGDFSANKVGIGRNLLTTGATDFVNRTEAFQVEGEAFKTLGTGNWIIPSDRRLKTNIVSLDSHEMLKKVLKMQGVTYNLIANPERGLQYGFIAQDLRVIFPDKVSENAAGYLSASYGDFDPMMVEAIKALNNKIEKLEKENSQLKNLNGRLDALLKVVSLKDVTK